MGDSQGQQQQAVRFESRLRQPRPTAQKKASNVWYWGFCQAFGGSVVSTAEKSSFEPYMYVYTQNYVCYRVFVFRYVVDNMFSYGFSDFLLLSCPPSPSFYIYLPSKPRWKCSVQICSSGKVAGLNPAICVLCAFMEVGSV